MYSILERVLSPSECSYYHPRPQFLWQEINFLTHKNYMLKAVSQNLCLWYTYLTKSSLNFCFPDSFSHFFHVFLNIFIEKSRKWQLIDRISILDICWDEKKLTTCLLKKGCTSSSTFYHQMILFIFLTINCFYLTLCQTLPWWNMEI